MRFAVFAGRILAFFLEKFRSGGSVLPGRVAGFISPNILEKLVGSAKVVFVTGSNGKTSTARMIVAVLRAHGLDVFTNSSGANMDYGIIASLLRLRYRKGIAILEVDEGYAPDLANRLGPEFSVFLNIQADQLNRFHDPEIVFQKLFQTALSTKKAIVVNFDDYFFSRISFESLDKDLEICGFSSEPTLLKFDTGILKCKNVLHENAMHKEKSVCYVKKYSNKKASVYMNGQIHEIQVDSAHQAINAAAAFTLCKKMLSDKFKMEIAIRSIASCSPAFGRGQTVKIKNAEIRIMLIKNSRSMQVNLETGNLGCIMIGVDGGTPDPSWIYSVNFLGIKNITVVTGTMAWQIALAFQYLGINVHLVEPNLSKAIKYFLNHIHPEDHEEKSSKFCKKSMILNYEVSMKVLRRYKHLRMNDVDC